MDKTYNILIFQVEITYLFILRSSFLRRTQPFESIVCMNSILVNVLVLVYEFIRKCFCFELYVFIHVIHVSYMSNTILLILHELIMAGRIEK